MKPVMPSLGSSEALRVGARVGPYRLLDQIGAGGMGRVFAAERADGEYEQRVALKLINKGEEDEELLPRFYQERQALARLAHPNIARLLDGGVTEDGQPYLVMEYIEGLPLDVYCEQHRCDTYARVRLFREALAGVQHAHQHFLVHRDLKPGNILVTSEGAPKLLDFGIAKWLQASPQAPKLTATGMQPMTLDYASPEQVKDEAVTTASDVYALGVLLYELLTGHSPYRKTTSGSYNLQKAICEEEPQAPSEAITRIESAPGPEEQSAKTLTPEIVSATRESSPQKLRRRLAGDLDRIVLKALRKEPQLRYGSVEQFSEDLRRYLEGQPVSAREGKLSYRAGKFMRRNAGKLSTAAVFVALILGFAINASVQANRIAKERDRALAASAFLSSTIKLLDPIEAPNDTLTARAQVEIGVERIKTTVAHQPDLQALLLWQYGDLNRKLGKFESADSLLRESLALRQRIYGNNHIEVAKVLLGLGRLSNHTGKYASAESLLIAAKSIYRDKLGEKSEDFVTASNVLAQTYTETKQFEKAANVLAQTRELMLQLRPQGSYELGELLLNLSHLNLEQARYDSAESNARRAYEMLLKFSSERNPELSSALNNWGEALLHQGKHAEAEPLLRKAYHIAAAAVTDDHPVTALIKSTLGACLTGLRRFAEAEPFLTSACQYLRANHGDENFFTQQALKNIIAHYEARGLRQEAEEYRRLLLPERAASN